METANDRNNVWNIVLRACWALVFLPNRKRWRTLYYIFKLLLELIRDGEEAVWNWMEKFEDKLHEMEQSDIKEDDDHANLQQVFMDAAQTLLPFFREGIIPRTYIWETIRLIRVTSEEDRDRVYSNLFNRFQRIIEGRIKPLFVPFTIPYDAELFKYLEARDAENAIEKLEGIPFEQVKTLIPSDSALIYLISIDSGTFCLIVQKDKSPEIILCQSLTRKRIENLLQGWLWLYYFHSEDIYTRAIDYQLGLKKRSREYEEAFKEANVKIPYALLYNNQALFDHLQPTEIPSNAGIPVIPFPSWLLMEAMLRELGKGDLAAGEGLWTLLDEKLRASKVKRVILCPDKAFSFFPHNAAILSIDRDGKKECMLDRYEMVYIPQGMLAKVKPVMSQLSKILLFGTDGEELTAVGIENFRRLAPDCISVWHSETDKEREQLATKMLKINALTFLGHGKNNWSNPSKSFLGLVLDRKVNTYTKKRGFNDVITLRELVEQVPPHLDLIVLAGCETGLPKITMSVTEYSGFAEALLTECNVSAVISTLWPVPLVSTALLMHEFHKYLLRGDNVGQELLLRPATALRKAQLWIRSLTSKQVFEELEKLVLDESLEEFSKERQALHNSNVEYPFAHPYFWASFYVMGDI